MTSLRWKRRMTPFAPHSTHLGRVGGSSGLNRVLSVRKGETIVPWGRAVAQGPSTEQLAPQALLTFLEHNLWAGPYPAATLPTRHPRPKPCGAVSPVWGGTQSRG